MLRRFFRSEAFPVLLLVAVNLAIGLLTFHHYGESIDENRIYLYARHSLDVYAGAFQHGFVSWAFDSVMDLYGPFYFVLALFGARLISVISPGHLVADNWHLVYFITFQIGVALFYFLARRWMSAWAAFGATLLMVFQPLFWGHAFINPKDIPFMVCFLATVLAGLRLADSLSVPDRIPFRKAPGSLRAKRIIFLFSILWVILVFFVIYAFRSNQLLQWVNWLIALILLTGIALLIAVEIIYARLDRESLRRVGTLFRKPWIWLAGCLLGMTVSFRVTGILACVLVACYCLYRLGRLAIPVLVAYAAVAGIVAYLVWPFLWPAPLTNFASTVLFMSKFPAMSFPVLFNGHFYDASALPFTYMPVLITLQLTEPVSIFFIAGCAVMLLLLRRGMKKDLSLLVGLWFFVPLVALVLLRPVMYDNFRQFIFLLPPVFLLAGMAFEALFERVRSSAWRVIIIVLCLFPGIYAGIKLHPYEYLYYNSLIGGVHGAVDRFETDYWTTAYRDAAEYVNQVAPGNAKIVTWGAYGAGFTRYARPDLQVFCYQAGSQPEGQYDYAVLTTRLGVDRDWYPDAPVIYRVEVEGVTLAVVKQIP